MARQSLNNEEFKAALAKGQGRALQEVRARGSLPDRGAVLDACIHNRAHDPQVEGNRARWMVEMLDAAGQAKSIWPEIRAAFVTTTDTWDLDQLCDFALIFAQREYPGSREAIYDFVRNQPIASATWLGEEQIVRLDGIEGFLWVVTQGLARDELEDLWWVYGNLLYAADEICGAEAVDAAVAVAAKSDPKFEQFGVALRDYRQHRDCAASAASTTSRDKFLAITAEQIIGKIKAGDPDANRFWLRRWGRHAPDESLPPVAEAMFAERDPERLVRYLSVFSGRALPAFDPRLLGFSEHPESEVRCRALAALKMYSEDTVRALALDRLGNGEVADGVLALLTRNYRPGDHLLIEAALRPMENVGELHWLIMDVLDIFEKNRTPDCIEALVFAYEQTPCSNCRLLAVEIMLDQDVFPDRYLEECVFDANEDIRDIVGGIG